MKGDVRAELLLPNHWLFFAFLLWQDRAAEICSLASNMQGSLIPVAASIKANFMSAYDGTNCL